MPGIYTRDQFAQQLAQAIENANARRQASLDREAARRKDNAAAIANFGKALGRTWETWDRKDDEAKLAELQKEREEAVKAQQEHDQALRLDKAEAMGDIGTQLAKSNSYNNAMLARDMAGYSTTPMVVVPNYADAMKRRSGVYAPRQDFDGVL